MGSDVLLFEIGKIKAYDRQRAIRSVFENVVKEIIPVSETVDLRTAEIMSVSSIHRMDAAHLASAEFGDADIFLTTDDKFIRACKNLNLKFRVLNPVAYFKEVIDNGGD